MAILHIYTYKCTYFNEMQANSSQRLTTEYGKIEYSNVVFGFNAVFTTW